MTEREKRQKPFPLDKMDDINLPPRQRIELPGRGGIYCYREAGERGKPTLLLLHGMLASGAVNWFRAFDPLSKHFHIIAPDYRGHGGSMPGSTFSVASTVDDIAVLLQQLNVGPVIACGYSMGGSVAQHLWRKHPELVNGLVFSATGYRGVLATPSVKSALAMPALRAMLFATRGVERLSRARRALQLRELRRQRAHRHTTSAEAKAAGVRRELWADFSRNTLRVTLEAARDIGYHNVRDWVTEINVPAAVLVTNRDNLFPADHQHKLGVHIRTANIFTYDAGHAALTQADYGEALEEACLDVLARLTNPSLINNTPEIDHMNAVPELAVA